MIGLNWAKQRAVRITHTLTGLWAESSGHRSQFLNRESAWSRLKSLIWSKEKGIEPKKEVVFTYNLDEYTEDEMFDKRREVCEHKWSEVYDYDTYPGAVKIRDSYCLKCKTPAKGSGQ